MEGDSPLPPVKSFAKSSLDGWGAWGRMDTWIGMAESLRSSPDTTTTWLIGYTPKQNKKFF